MRFTYKGFVAAPGEPHGPAARGVMAANDGKEKSSQENNHDAECFDRSVQLMP